MRSIAIIFVVPLFFLSGCSDQGGDVPAVANPPEFSFGPSLADHNFVLITVDALRPDHLSCYGYTDAQTPGIDALAESGLRFTNAYANSSFLGQSMSVLLTGRLPTYGGTIDLLGSHPHDSTITMAEWFLAEGRATGLFTNQALLQSRGFTSGYEDVVVRGGESAATASEITEEALVFVEDVGDEPYFLHVHYAEPHEPYGDPEDENVRHTVRGIRENYAMYAKDDELRREAMAELIERYDAEIAAVDAAVQQLVDGIEGQDNSNWTAILFTSTHGEEFWEHGYVGHAWTLYDEVLRVPLILYAPYRIPPRTLDTTVSLADWVPTFVNIFEFDRSEDYFMNGTFRFMPSGNDAFFLNTLSFGVAELVLRDRCVLRASIYQEWKYIAPEHWPLPEDRNTRLETPLPLWQAPKGSLLFNTADDPREKTNVAESNHEQVVYHLRNLERYRNVYDRDGIPPHESAGEMEIGDTEDRESLETLGYL